MATQANFLDLGFKILADYPQESFGTDTFRPTVVLQPIPWADRLAAVRSILGGVDSEGAVTLPAKYDELTISADVTPVASTVTIQPFNGRKDMTDPDNHLPEYAQLQVEFDVPQWTTATHSSTEYTATESFEKSAEFLTLSPDDLQWNNPAMTTRIPVKPEEAPGKLLIRGVWTITTHFIGKTAVETADNFVPFIGSCNQYELVSPRYGTTFEPETLMMDVPQIDYISSGFGEHVDVTFILYWNPGTIVTSTGGRYQKRGITGQPHGWNVFYRGGDPEPLPMFRSVGAPKNDPYFRPYKPMDWGTWVPRAES